MFLPSTSRGVDETFSLIPGLDEFLAFLVGLGIGLGVSHHLVGSRHLSGHPEAWIVIFCPLPVPLSLAETDTIPLASMSKVTSILRHPAAVPVECSQVLNWPSILLSAAISRFALEDPDGHGVLVVLGGRKYLRLLCRNRGVPVDQAREHPPPRVSITERQRRDVEEDHVLHVALKNAGLDPRRPRPRTSSGWLTPLVLGSFPPKNFGDLFQRTRGHPRHAADKHPPSSSRLGEAGHLSARPLQGRSTT